MSCILKTAGGQRTAFVYLGFTLDKLERMLSPGVHPAARASVTSNQRSLISFSLTAV